MSNQVVVTLSARDLISPQLAQLRANIDAVGARARASISARALIGMSAADIRRLRENMRLLEHPNESQGFLGAALFGSLGATAIAQGIALVSQGVSRLQGLVMDAAKQQTASLALSGDLATQLGISFGNAKGLVAETRAEISKMAAALPGENQDYMAIFNNISATVAKTSGGDLQKFKSDAMELTRTYGVLAKIRPNVDVYSGGSATNRLMSGTMGIGEAFATNDIFQKNPLLRDYIQAQLKIIGKSEADWKQLTTDTRKNILIAAGKQAVSQETLAAFDGTVESMLALAQTTIFDQDIGIFGFLRKIKEAQGRSGLDAVSAALSSLGFFFSALGRIGGKLGLTSETPMALIIKTIDFFTDFTNSATGFLNGGYVNWGQIGEDFGRQVGQTLGDFIKAIDWIGVAKAVGKSFIAAIETLNGALKGVIQGLIGSLGGMLNGQVNSTLRTLSGGLPIPQVDVAGALGKANEVLGAGAILNPLGGVVENVKPLLSPSAPTTDTKKSFAPQVNIQATTNDPQSIASAVMSAIDDLYSNYMENQLA